MKNTMFTSTKSKQGNEQTRTFEPTNAMRVQIAGLPHTVIISLSE